MSEFIYFLFKIRNVIKYVRGFVWRIIIILSGGKCGKGLMVDKGFVLKHPPHKGLKFGSNIYIGTNTTLDVPANSLLVVDDFVSLTGFTYISAAESVTLGKYTLVGEFVSIRDANHGIDGNSEIHTQPMIAAALAIGCNCWIGRGAAILKGSNIGDGSVVGANAVVSHKIENRQIVVGIPAKTIKIR
jgi:acetyltransferase-like isoleucine patch superfamily enzyme